MKQNGDRILVVVNPTKPSDQASISRGAWLANKFGLGLDLFICDYQQALTIYPFLDTIAIEQSQNTTVSESRQGLEEIAGALRKQGLDVEINVAWDTPVDEGIIRHVLRTRPKFVIKETTYYPSIGRALFTNTDWNLVRLCPVPLWLTKSGAWDPNATVLASLDPTHENDEYSELDQQILELAAFVAEKSNSELHAFHSFVPITSIPVMQPDAGLIPDLGAREEIRKSHAKRMDLQLKNYEIKQENIHLMSGRPEHLLPEVAKDTNAGLIVMGSIARNALQRIFIGSTTEKVLHKLPCDLLVVKPEWFITSVRLEE